MRTETPADLSASKAESQEDDVVITISTWTPRRAAASSGACDVRVGHLLVLDEERVALRR